MTAFSAGSMFTSARALRLAALVSATIVVTASGCTPEEGSTHPQERIGEPTSDNVNAILSGGQFLYVLRDGSVDRIDERTGVAARVAGSGWRTCPMVGDAWSGEPYQARESNVLLHGTQLFLVSPCGVWSFDVDSGVRRMLVDASLATMAGRQRRSSNGLASPAWNGGDGPAWDSSHGMALANDRDGLVGCFLTGSSATPDEPRDLELWSFAIDGHPKTLLARIDQPLSNVSSCTSIVSDEAGIVFATQTQLFTLDRASGRVALLASDTRIGNGSVATNETDVWLRRSNGAIVRLPRAGGSEIVIWPAPSHGSDWQYLTLDGQDVYFRNGGALARIKTSGDELVVLADAEGDRYIETMPISITAGHVYFETVSWADRTNRTLVRLEK